jgi:hypothetical protein
LGDCPASGPLYDDLSDSESTGKSLAILVCREQQQAFSPKKGSCFQGF